MNLLSLATCCALLRVQPAEVHFVPDAKSFAESLEGSVVVAKSLLL